MPAAYSLARDLAELEHMLERLNEYVLGDRLYLPFAANFARRSTAPQLTLGALLLRRRRLRQLRPSASSDQQLRLDAALARHHAVQNEWTLHYENKLKEEVPARLKQMGSFFHECQENPTGCAAAYPQAALRRTIVQEILLAMDEFGYDKRVLTASVERTDIALRRLLQADAFIWSAALRPLYPRRDFWWLYLLLASHRDCHAPNPASKGNERNLWIESYQHALDIIDSPKRDCCLPVSHFRATVHRGRCDFNLYGYEPDPDRSCSASSASLSSNGDCV